MIKNSSTELVASTIGAGNSNLFIKRHYGESMCPELKPGDLLLCRKLSTAGNINSYLWGHIYLLATERGVIIGRINPGLSESTITIVRDNPKCDNFEIPIKCIHEVAMLIGRVTEYAY